MAEAVDPDWNEDTATLIYDGPGQSSVPPPLFTPARAAEAQPRRARLSVPAFSVGQIVLIIGAALIGAIGGAWSIAQEERAAAVIARPLAPRPSDAARTQPDPVGPAQPAPAPSVNAQAPSAKVEAAPAPEPASEPQPTERVAPVAAAQALPVAPEPARADAAVKPERRKQRARVRSRAVRSAPAPAARAEAPPARTANTETAAPRMGLLRINSRPWSKVFVDGRPVGNTPQSAIELAPGTHRIALISDEFDLKRTLTIQVRPGETVTRSVELLQ